MQHSFILLIFAITATHGFMHAFLADDSAVFPVLPNASRRFQLPSAAHDVEQAQQRPRPQPHHAHRDQHAPRRKHGR
jgi:hypothetical protein